MLFYAMKYKISITIDEDKIKQLEKFVKEGKFRNKSHIIEYSLNKLLGEMKNEWWFWWGTSEGGYWISAGWGWF